MSLNKCVLRQSNQSRILDKVVKKYILCLIQNRIDKEKMLLKEKKKKATSNEVLGVCSVVAWSTLLN